jgi:crotonobetainyl-CoA:carnitine CoA-transferase CaiB-like acyl-CoA transferase
VRASGPVATFGANPSAVRRHAPLHPGEHSAEILREAGYSDGELETLLRDGAVQQGYPAPAAAG